VQFEFFFEAKFSSPFSSCEILLRASDMKIASNKKPFFMLFHPKRLFIMLLFLGFTLYIYATYASGGKSFNPIRQRRGLHLSS
jgi:hypothetical protein